MSSSPTRSGTRAASSCSTPASCFGGPGARRVLRPLGVRPRDSAEVLPRRASTARRSPRSRTATSTSTTPGQNALFPGIPIYVQRAEWAAAHEPDYTSSPSIDFPGATYSSTSPATTSPRRASGSSRRRATRPAISRSSSTARTARCSSPARRSTATASGPASPDAREGDEHGPGPRGVRPLGRAAAGAQPEARSSSGTTARAGP